jgi:hypothetical protein
MQYLPWLNVLPTITNGWTFAAFLVLVAVISTAAGGPVCR